MNGTEPDATLSRAMLFLDTVRKHRSGHVIRCGTLATPIK